MQVVPRVCAIVLGIGFGVFARFLGSVVAVIRLLFGALWVSNPLWSSQWEGVDPRAQGGIPDKGGKSPSRMGVSACGER